MPIHRTVKNGNFTRIDNEIFQAELSPKAGWLLVYLLSKPDDWTVNADHLAKTLGMGVNQVRKFLRELKLRGFADWSRSVDGSTHWEIYESPSLSPEHQKRFKGATQKPKTVVRAEVSPQHQKPKHQNGVVLITTEKALTTEKNSCASKKDARFDEWYSIYPKKKGKVAARNAWKRKNLDSQADDIIRDTKERMRVEWNDKQYIPMASTYVNQERWHDEIENRRVETRTTLPKDDNEMVAFALARGIGTQPGESYDEMRTRVQRKLGINP